MLTYRLNMSDVQTWQGVTGLIVLAGLYNLCGYLLLRYHKPKFLALAPAPEKGKGRKGGVKKGE